ncbi:MAG: hypothetical protein K0S23_1969 [Fluviicola sp.]|jgi:hypothetical protein|uniref:carboxypeptidase-like regulatory domain-containing protein n=1 Tax=Fluviicola sp. TaxID=1917219 RepID=UPI0026142D9A|nr:carboxypeptidase-like regulatory domain-containing protein [Fluviicola sp.]MDF3027662.1 hypothetical protein [Fluviicola sp.]
MKHLNHTGLIFLLLFAGGAINTTWSQVEAIVKGKVVTENGAPIKNASVKLGSSDARTNNSGFFIVKNSTFPAKLTVTHSLYAEYLDMVVLPEKRQDTIRVFVVMTGKEKELEEVTISAEKVWVYPRKQANVLDFLVQPDNGILLCCSDENRYFIRSLNAKGEKTNEIPIRNHPKKLYRDCMETIHLIYSDSIYETAFIDNSIGIFQAKAVMGIFNLLKSCVYKDDKNLVKYNYSNEDQRIEYLAIDIQSKQSRTLYVGEDRTEYRQMEEYAYEHYMADEKMFHSQTSEQLKITRGIWNEKQYYDLIVINPVYIPLFELNDSLFIFDHVNDSAVVFTRDGMRVRSFPIVYQYFDGWKKELITNLEKTKIFARYDSEGITTLREINTTNGKTERIIQLEKHVFPEHLQIHEDFIYYIYKDYLNQSMHYIFKQRLE